MLPFMCSCTYSESFVKITQDLFTLCLNDYVYVDWSILLVLANQPSMSLYLLVVLYCSMYFRRHGGGSLSGSGLWLSDSWYV